MSLLSNSRHSMGWSPIGAAEWGKEDSTYLKDTGHWKTVSNPARGDIATNGVHVAVVTGPGETVSSAKEKVVQNDWGFDPPNRVATLFWRYKC